MDLGLILSIVLPLVSAIGGGGLAWGAFRTEFKHLRERLLDAETIIERLEQAAREREQQTNVLMAEAVKSMGSAVEHLASWGNRYEERMVRTEHRSRANRAALRQIERARTEATKRKLERAGLPTEVLEEVSGALEPRDWETTQSIPREELKR